MIFFYINDIILKKEKSGEKMDNEKIIKLAEFINTSKKTVFFGGAGVSTESGV